MPTQDTHSRGNEAPDAQEKKPMNDQPTRAREPEADPRQPFTLPLERAQALALAIVEDGHDDSRPNVTQFWVETGEAMGFTWNTVQDVVGEFEGLDPKGDVTFTAWALPAAWQPDPDALAWLDAMVVEGDTGTLKNRELILRAWASGRDTGFAMGSATAQANRPGLGWDGMELLKESAELLRFYRNQTPGPGAPSNLQESGRACRRPSSRLPWPAPSWGGYQCQSPLRPGAHQRP